MQNNIILLHKRDVRYSGKSAEAAVHIARNAGCTKMKTNGIKYMEASRVTNDSGPACGWMHERSELLDIICSMYISYYGKL